MNYAPAVQDQSAAIILGGLRMGQESQQNALRLYQYLQGRADAKDAAVGQLETMNQDGGFNPSTGGADNGNPENPSMMDQAEASGKKADAIRNVLTAYSPHPQTKTALKAMSLGELEGMLKGYATNAAMQEHSARMADYQAHADLRRQQAADDVSIGTFLQNYAKTPDVATPPGENDSPYAPVTMRPASPMERFNYAMGASPVTGRAVPRLIDALGKYSEMEDDQPRILHDTPFPNVALVTSRRGGAHVVENPATKNGGAEDLTPGSYEDTVTGARFVYRGKQLYPAGYNPEKAKPTLEPLHNTSGELVGWGQLDARGNSKFIANRSSEILRQAKDADGNPVQGFYVDAQGRVHDARSAMQKTLGPQAGPAMPGKPAEKGKGGKKSYQSAAEVRDDPDLSRDEKLEILRKQFGMK